MDDNEFRSELERLINRHSQENGSGTPDFVLANYLDTCLRAFDLAVNARERWYGRPQDPTFHTPVVSRPTLPAVDTGL